MTRSADAPATDIARLVGRCALDAMGVQRGFDAAHAIELARAEALCPDPATRALLGTALEPRRLSLRHLEVDTRLCMETSREAAVAGGIGLALTPLQMYASLRFRRVGTRAARLTVTVEAAAPVHASSQKEIGHEQ